MISVVQDAKHVDPEGGVTFLSDPAALARATLTGDSRYTPGNRG
jgi:hypothetical protein